jgi:hypothetical protein
VHTSRVGVHPSLPASLCPRLALVPLASVPASSFGLHIDLQEELMTFDQSKIGQVVAAQMEALEGRYGDDCEIGNVCTIVEVLGPHGSDISVRSSEARPHTTIGLLRMAEAMVLGSLGRATGGEE